LGDTAVGCVVPPLLLLPLQVAPSTLFTDASYDPYW
jgi:hypothetical protein